MESLNTFQRAAEAAGATVERVPFSAQEVANAVHRAAGAACRVAVAESLDLPKELLDACRGLAGVFTERSKQDLASADVGITEAFAGIARTGTICVSVDHGHAGSISLLARQHVALLSAQDIIERPADLFTSGRLASKGLTRNFVFVTGPSATADMGPLVRGVHGPHRLHILVLV